MNNQITQVRLASSATPQIASSATPQIASSVTPQIASSVTPKRRSAFKALGNKKKKPDYNFPKVFEVSDDTHYDLETYSSLTDHGDFD